MGRAARAVGQPVGGPPFNGTAPVAAFQASDLRFSLPTLTIGEPLVAIAIGQFLFGERIASGGLAPLLELATLAVMTAGVFCHHPPIGAGRYSGACLGPVLAIPLYHLIGLGK